MKYSIPLYRAESGFSIPTQEYLTFKTADPQEAWTSLHPIARREAATSSRTRLPSTPTIQVNTQPKRRLTPTRYRPRRTDRP